MTFDTLEEHMKYLRDNHHARNIINQKRMRSRDVAMINKDIAKKRKAIVSLGCSFTQGLAAFDQPILDFLRPQGGQASDFDYVCKAHDPKDLLNLCQEFNLDFSILGDAERDRWNGSTGSINVNSQPYEVNNAFVNRMTHLLDESWVPINMGNAGNGNKSAINRLFQYPIDWHLCDQILVVWCYSDLNRLDLVKDINIDHSELGHDHDTMWPKPTPYDPGMEKFRQGEDWHNVQYYFTRTLWSEAFNYQNFIQHGRYLDTWCKATGANLITLPAFADVTKSEIEHEFCLNKRHRDANKHLDDTIDIFPFAESYVEHNQKAIDLFPWDSVCEPAGEKTFFHYAYSQEPEYGEKERGLNMWQVIDQGGTPNDWIFPCGHPSGKAHHALAEWLVTESERKGFL